MDFEGKNLEKPDELREFPKGRANLVHVGGHTVGRGTIDPGWRWSTDIKPIAKTDSCQFLHTGVVLGGTLHVELNDGTSIDFNKDDVYVIPPGHDAWVVGDKPVQTLDWSPRLDEFGKAAKISPALTSAGRFFCLNRNDTHK